MNDVPCFLNILMFLALVYLEFGHFDKAIFFLMQGKKICNYVRNSKHKAMFLRGIAKTATVMKMHNESIIILNKGESWSVIPTLNTVYLSLLSLSLIGLQYAWECCDTDQEILIYDNLGLNHFYRCEVDIAKIYHEKFVNGEVEDEYSFTRRASSTDI